MKLIGLPNETSMIGISLRDNNVSLSTVGDLSILNQDGLIT